MDRPRWIDPLGAERPHLEPAMSGLCAAAAAAATQWHSGAAAGRSDEGTLVGARRRVEPLVLAGFLETNNVCANSEPPAHRQTHSGASHPGATHTRTDGRPHKGSPVDDVRLVGSCVCAVGPSPLLACFWLTARALFLAAAASNFCLLVDLCVCSRTLCVCVCIGNPEAEEEGLSLSLAFRANLLVDFCVRLLPLSVCVCLRAALERRRILRPIVLPVC